MIVLTDHHCLPRDSAKFQKKLISNSYSSANKMSSFGTILFAHYNVQMINDEIDLTSLG